MTQYYLPPDPPEGMPAFDGIIDESAAWVPSDPANRHWAEYQEWLAAGNTPKEYPPEGLPLPPPPMKATPEPEAEPASEPKPTPTPTRTTTSTRRR